MLFVNYNIIAPIFNCTDFVIFYSKFVEMHKSKEPFRHFCPLLELNRLLITIDRDGLGCALLVREREHRF